MIDKATAQKIKDTADIVDVVSDYVHLKRSGANYMGLCPFHNERTPSFHVNKVRNFCYCFSCHKGGSPVNFIMEKEGISYPEALRQLAAKYGIKIEEREQTPEEKERQSEREAMLAANLWAMDYFENTLHETEEGETVGLSYLYGKREVTYEAVKAFHLGYALDSGFAFVKAAKEKGLRMEVLETLGLIGKSSKGNLYGKYAGRVIFPIQNSSGKVVGFGGRDLKGGLAKYINSPESDIYKKSHELYGLYQAKNAIGKNDECYLVEGYLDVISMWQAGLKNVVASSGTSLTDGQIALIKRFTNNVTLIYDGDAPGIKAALKGVDLLLANEMDVNVLILPDGDDPDTFARKHSPESLKEYIDSNKTDVIRFKINILMKGAEHSSMKRFEAIHAIVKSIAQIPDRLKRIVYAQDSSYLLNVSEADMHREVEKQRYLMKAQSRPSATVGNGEYRQPSPPPAHASPSGDTQINEPEPASVRKISPEKFELMNYNCPSASYPLMPMEWKVLQYCIRYGFGIFCYEDVMDENSVKSQRPINVVDFVEEELAADNTNFSLPEFKYVFELIKKMKTDFERDAESFREKLSNEKHNLLSDGYASIAETYSSTSDIERAEKKLEDEIGEWEILRFDEFSKSYVANMLSNHEEDFVRKLANEAICEKHQLSNIFSRERRAEREEDKLLNLIPTSLSVWKNGLLDLRIKELFNKFRELKGKERPDEEQAIQLELNNLLHLRSEIAKNIGDRILIPGKRVKQ